MTEAEMNEKAKTIQFIWGEIRAPRHVPNQEPQANATQEQASTQEATRKRI